MMIMSETSETFSIHRNSYSQRHHGVYVLTSLIYISNNIIMGNLRIREKTIWVNREMNFLSERSQCVNLLKFG